MFSTRKHLLRALSVALVAYPVIVAAGCAADADAVADVGAQTDAGTDSAMGHPTTDAGDDEPADGAPVATSCGNGKIDPGEECDDKNKASGDGCSSTCKLESAGIGDLCADALDVPLVQQDGGTLYKATLPGSTSTLFNQYAANCGGGSGADIVYKVTPPLVGRIVARVTASFPAILSARTACGDAKTEVACKDTTTTQGGSSEIALSAYPDGPIYFFVDGFGGAKGDFVLDIEIQTAFCGNGQAEFPEQCDDGNTADHDGCSSTCTLEDTSTTSTCPGMGYRLAPGIASFAGDTSTLSNGGGTGLNCTPTGSGPNAIYAITPTVTGAMKLDLLANYPNALLHVRRECVGTSNASQFDCKGAGTTDVLVPLSSTVPVFAEQTIFAFVDSGSSSNAGLYTLNATLTAAACGNGLVDGGEECDDGNTTDGDGCSSTCTGERDPATFACDGKAIRLEGDGPGPRTLTLRGTTSPAPGESVPTNKWSSTTAANCQGAGRDVVYALTSDIDGYLEVTVKSDLFNAFASLRSECVPGQATAPVTNACSKASTGNVPKTFYAAVEKDKTYYLVVDGNGATAEGAFELELEVQPSVCGNSVVEGGETCDDGALDDGDGCDSTCQLEAEKARDTCATAPPVSFTDDGDGTYSAKVVSGTTNLTHTAGSTTTQTLGSSCPSRGPDAWFTVTPPIGGVLTARITEATFPSSLGVRTSCSTGTGPQLACDGTASSGGQQVIAPVTEGQSYRVIVDGQAATDVGRFTLEMKIIPSGCGDTFLVPPEQCDDGNTEGGDGCSATCAYETLPALASCPGHTVALTGTGKTVRRAVATISTAGLPKDAASTCGGSGPEGILEITSDIAGSLEVRATSDFSALLYGRTQCSDVTTEIPRSCSSNLGVFSTSVQPNVPTYVYVDGINGASGVSKLQITVTP